MEAAMKRIRGLSRKALLEAAGVAGGVWRSVPGAAGALLVSFGMWDIWRPLGLLTAGLFLLAIDRQTR